MAVSDDPQLKAIAEQIATVVASLSSFEAPAASEEMRAAQSALRNASYAYNTLTRTESLPTYYGSDYY